MSITIFQGGQTMPNLQSKKPPLHTYMCSTGYSRGTAHRYGDNYYLVHPRWRDAVQATAVLGVLAIDFLHESMFLHDIDRCENSSMLTVQGCQHHRLVVVHPNKAKSFPAATVPAVEKLGHRRRRKCGTRSEERRNARRAHASKHKCR